MVGKFATIDLCPDPYLLQFLYCALVQQRVGEWMEGNVAQFYRYPFDCPSDVALVCKSPDNGRFYCQVVGCTQVEFASEPTARRHLADSHGDYPKAKVRMVVS